MSQNIQAFVHKLNELIRKAESEEMALSRHLYAGSGHESDEPDEDLEQARYYLKEYTRAIYRDLRMLADRLGLEGTRYEIREIEKSHSDLSHVEADSETPSWFSPALREAIGYFKSLRTISTGADPGSLDAFHNILDSSGKIIADLQLIPSGEVAVRNQILTVVRYAFHDARKETNAPNTLTNFKMDVAVPSLRAAAEYKFADKALAVQKCLEGYYADMIGYDGEQNWQHFFAVLYQTNPFVTQKQVEAEFKKVRARENWTPIVITGPGSRESGHVAR